MRWFEARVGDSALRGDDLVDVDGTLDEINGVTVMARPIAGLMALGARMSDGR